MLYCEFETGVQKYLILRGVPQESVLELILWNVIYDNVLRFEIPNEAKTLGFADNIAIEVAAKILEEAEDNYNETIQIVKRWLLSVSLAIPEHTTEAVLNTTRKKIEVKKTQKAITIYHSS